MIVTTLGLKKPQDGDNADFIVFVADNMDTLNTLISGKANATHTHASSDVNSGTLDANRIPNLDMGKITTGNLITTRLYEPTYVTSSVSITGRPLFDILRADRTAFLPASQIIIETSTDGGATWQDAGISDVNKTRLFTGQRPNLSIPLKGGVRNTDCMLRVTITGMRYNVPAGTAETAKYGYWGQANVLSTERYCTLSEGWVWLSSVADRIHLKVERATGANPNTWNLEREAFMAGWSGGNYFSLSGTVLGGGTTQTGNSWNWRFTFRTATTSNDFDNAKLSASYTTSAQAINHIKLSGPSVWTYPNNLMYNDHLYSWDELQNATFPGDISVRGNSNNKLRPMAIANTAPSNPMDKDLWIDTSV